MCCCLWVSSIDYKQFVSLIDPHQHHHTSTFMETKFCWKFINKSSNNANNGGNYLFACHSLGWHWLNMMRVHFFEIDNNERILSLCLLGLFSSSWTFRFEQGLVHLVLSFNIGPRKLDIYFIFTISISVHTLFLFHMFNVINTQWNGVVDQSGLVKVQFRIIEFNVNISYHIHIDIGSNATMLNWSFYVTSHSYNKLKCLLILLPTCRHWKTNVIRHILHN